MNRHTLFLSLLIISPIILISSEKQPPLSPKRKKTPATTQMLATGYNQLIKQITALEKQAIALEIEQRKLTTRTIQLEAEQKDIDDAYSSFDDKLTNILNIASKGITDVQLKIEDKLLEQSKAISSLTSELSVYKSLRLRDVNDNEQSVDISIIIQLQNKASEQTEQIATLLDSASKTVTEITNIFEVIDGLQKDFGVIQEDSITTKTQIRTLDPQHVDKAINEFKKKITHFENLLYELTKLHDRYTEKQVQFEKHIDSSSQTSSDQVKQINIIHDKLNKLENTQTQSTIILHDEVVEVRTILEKLQKSIADAKDKPTKNNERLLPAEELAIHDIAQTLDSMIEAILKEKQKHPSFIEEQLYALARHHIMHMNSIIAIGILHCISWTTLEILDTQLPVIITQFKRQNIHRKVIACAAFNTFLNTVFDTTKNGWRVMSIFAGLDLCTNAIHTLWHANKYYKRIATAYRRTSSPTMRSYLSWLTKTVIAHIIA